MLLLEMRTDLNFKATANDFNDQTKTNLIHWFYNFFLIYLAFCIL